MMLPGGGRLARAGGERATQAGVVHDRQRADYDDHQQDGGTADEPAALPGG
jgi:hypothetical protein